jgi:phosphatidylinositol alpha-1,6-mannosyltransferase
MDIPIIATIHHPYTAEKRIIKEKLGYADSIRYSFYRRIDFLARMEKKICERVDRIIAVSNYTAKVLIDEYQVPSKNITVIPNAVDTNRFNPKIDGQHAIREKIGLHSEPIILFVGRLDHTKGMEYLIEAFSMLVKEIPDVKLVLVGKGPLKKSLQMHLNKSVLKKSVLFYGAASNNELPQIYAASNVVALPSLIEGFGIVLLEAMATAKPCVAAKAGGTEDAIEDGVTGFLVPHADSKALFEKIFILLEDKELSNKFGNAGRKRVEKMFTWERVAQQTIELYEIFLME